MSIEFLKLTCSDYRVNTLADPLQFSALKAPVDVSDETTPGVEDFDELPTSSMEDENPFDQLSDSRPLTPIPDLQLRDDQLPDNRPITPTPDFHLQGDGGPSEPISWAFQRQALANPLETEPRRSPLGAFGEESSPPPPPISPSPTAVSEGHIDPDLLKLSAAAPTSPTMQYSVARSPMTTRTVTQASTHPLSSLSTRPSFVFDTFLSGGLSKAAPTPRPLSLL
jgi:hypothetical protein